MSPPVVAIIFIIFRILTGIDWHQWDQCWICNMINQWPIIFYDDLYLSYHNYRVHISMLETLSFTLYVQYQCLS